MFARRVSPRNLSHRILIIDIFFKQIYQIVYRYTYKLPIKSAHKRENLKHSMVYSHENGGRGGEGGLQNSK